MKIIADENMPYVKTLFSHLGDIQLVNGRKMTAKIVSDADILLVRSVSQVNSLLLGKNNRLKFVGSATIGTDHVDLDFLKQKNIHFSYAPGCNATAVGEYAFIALLELAERDKIELSSKTVGIIGAGNTGSALASCLNAFGVSTLFCDPFLAKKGDARQFESFDNILQKCDVISLHVPITKDGEYPTFHLFDEKILLQLRQNTWLVNCCRGDVIDNHALLTVKKKRPDLRLVLDVWHNEPNPLQALVNCADIATPHIAGYSLEGKVKGTFMLYQSLCHYLNLTSELSFANLLPAHYIRQVTVNSDLNQQQLLSICQLVYNIKDDDRLFRQMVKNDGGFDDMRRKHHYRREFSALSLAKHGQFDVNWLTKLGFSGDGL